MREGKGRKKVTLFSWTARESEYPSIFLPLYKLGKLQKLDSGRGLEKEKTVLINREKKRCFVVEKKTERWDQQRLLTRETLFTTCMLPACLCCSFRGNH